MKKLWVLVVAVVLALAACGDDDAGTESDTDNPVLETPTTVSP